MSGNGTKQTRLRQQAIAALITQPTVEIAAKHSGVSYSTLNRWLKDKQFAAEVAAARNELLNGAIQRLKAAAFNAVGVLVEVSDNPASSDMARVSASKTLIELALRVGTIEALERRIDELERNANGGIEDAATAGRTIEGNDEQKRSDTDDGGREANSDWQITLASRLC